MSSMPGHDGYQPRGGTEERPGPWPEEPGQYGGSGMPGRQGYAGDTYGDHWAGQQAGFGHSPVPQQETSVVGRRVIQYVIDYVLVGIIPGIALWIFDRGHGFLHGLGWLIAAAISAVVYLWYWVLHPASHDGQTFGMRLLGLRIVSNGGGAANILQYFVRAVLLLIDTFAFGLIGLASMVLSPYHQRIGDHVARTLVVAAPQGPGGPGDFAGGGRAGHRFEADDERLARPGMEGHDPYGQDYGEDHLGGQDSQDHAGGQEQPENTRRGGFGLHRYDLLATRPVRRGRRVRRVRAARAPQSGRPTAARPGRRRAGSPRPAR